jgi:hypothetical protein
LIALRLCRAIWGSGNDGKFLFIGIVNLRIRFVGHGLQVAFF